MSVPTAAGTRRVAGVSRRRPRSGPVRVRVGGWLDVITPPSSHMFGGCEAPPRALRRGQGWDGRGGTAAGGHRLAGGGEGPSECVYAHACQRCAEALLRRTVVEHAGPVCPGLQTLPLRAAFAPTGAFGSACFVVSGRRWRGHPATVWDTGRLCRPRPQPARSLLPVSVLLQAPRRARRGRGSARLRGVRPPLSRDRNRDHPCRPAHPPPVKPRPPLSPGKGHFCAISGRQGRLEFHRTHRPATQGRLEFHPATRLPLATVEMSQTAASRARLPHDRAQRGSTTGLRARPGQRSGGRRACVSPRSAANRFT